MVVVLFLGAISHDGLHGCISGITTFKNNTAVHVGGKENSVSRFSDEPLTYIDGWNLTRTTQAWSSVIFQKYLQNMWPFLLVEMYEDGMRISNLRKLFLFWIDSAVFISIMDFVPSRSNYKHLLSMSLEVLTIREMVKMLVREKIMAHPAGTLSK